MKVRSKRIWLIHDIFLQPNQNPLLLRVFMDLFCSFVRVNLLADKVYLFFTPVASYVCTCTTMLDLVAFQFENGAAEVAWRSYWFYAGAEEDASSDVQSDAYNNEKWKRLWGLPSVRRLLTWCLLRVLPAFVIAELVSTRCAKFLWCRPNSNLRSSNNRARKLKLTFFHGK